MPLAEGQLIWVRLPRACFGLIVRDGIVVDAAPYMRRQLVGRTELAAAELLQRKGARFAHCDKP